MMSRVRQSAQRPSWRSMISARTRRGIERRSGLRKARFRFMAHGLSGLRRRLVMRRSWAVGLRDRGKKVGIRSELFRSLKERGVEELLRMIGEGVADRQRGDCPPQQRIRVGNGRELEDQFGWLAEVTVNTPWFAGIPSFAPGHLHAGVVAEHLGGEAAGSSVTVFVGWTIGRAVVCGAVWFGGPARRGLGCIGRKRRSIEVILTGNAHEREECVPAGVGQG